MSPALEFLEHLHERRVDGPHVVHVLGDHDQRDQIARLEAVDVPLGVGPKAEPVIQVQEAGTCNLSERAKPFKGIDGDSQSHRVPE